ncbi:protein of unknown function [Porphyromonadaceae bacterium NLAE-zl-C104]|uniref:DUF4855 domain-containing protein n=1 Tax=Proteiniphilum saccharofermentans TaxID=1642647 RepID=UPI0008E310B8|nr:DUF4855 domain-containing protein [Proteiniphilum saccharofermentans]SFS32575.1 protein of unknown function [Porphyromonadaceae bacterium NLAE-zl-C104]
MKKFALLFISLFLILVGCNAENENKKTELPETPPPNEEDGTYLWEKNRAEMLECKDMVLLYSGGVHRNFQWDENYVRPYVTYTDDSGKESWLFDSFLFLEIHNGAGKTFATGYTDNPANQKEWKELVDHYFQSRYCMGALNRSIDKAIERIGEPKEKRKIIIGLPEPIRGQKDWGSVRNGVPLDFSNPDDRIAAVKWYIDYVRQKFNEMQYDNLELAGFYWIAEEATNTRSIVADIATYLNDLKYSFNWIPYFKSDGYSEWEKLSFNYAYLQPNYFFNENIPYSRLEEACELAKQYNMDMEIEFDERALSGWGYRLEDYLKAFKEHGIWQTKRLAYYQGGRALYDLSISTDKNNRELYHTFCRFVIDR